LTLRARSLLVTTFIIAALLPVTAAAAAPVKVLTGSTPDTRIMPSNIYTVADANQLTGIRVNLPIPVCDATNSSVCDDLTLLNLQDGFDLRPRVAVPFGGPIDVGSVNAATFYVTGPNGFRTPVTQLVWNPTTNMLAGEPSDFLSEATTYNVVVTRDIKDQTGQRVIACGGSCTSTFTTETATPELAKLRVALDNGTAYSAAGINAAERSANFVQGGVRDVFAAATVTQVERGDQVWSDPARPLTFSTVLNTTLAGAGYYAFGSFTVPRYQTYADAVIPNVPTTRTPQPIGKQRVGFTLIVPAGVQPAGGWPVAIFGPGFTRSKYDLFLAADLNATRGIATIATDPAGHAFGPASVDVVHQGAVSTTFSGYGQGADLDSDGVIGASEGVGPTDHKTVDANGSVIADAPSRYATTGLRDGLIQTAVNVMSLVRVIEQGVDLLGDGTVTLQHHVLGYYGQSFGAIYGTMLMATDTHLTVGLLNVGGGPIVEIARLSGFRNLLADTLRVSRPTLLNGGPGLNGFTESMPLRLDPPLTNPYAGSDSIQRFFDHGSWQARAGDPVAFAPLLRLRPPAGAPAKHVIFQTAFGDHTVPNATAGELYRAGRLFDLVSYYRNDKTPTAGSDPHGFLLDPRLFGRDQGQAQMLEFISSGGATVIDPDGPGPIWEVPIANPRNLDCTHYPQPQTGVAYTASAGEC
jgi:Big-like domain-containing protein